MGIIISGKMKEEDAKFHNQSQYDELSDDNNGLFLSGKFFPEELISNILLYLNLRELVLCRQVCHTWNRIIDYVVFFEKIKSRLHHVEIYSEPVHQTPSNLPFYLSFAILHGSLGTNLLKNPFGSEQPRFKHWKIEDEWHVHYEDDDDDVAHKSGWKVEEEPVGSDPLPEHLSLKTCFVTTYYLCAKSQLIKLSECGLNDKIMDEVQPDIEVSEWFARRFDCGVLYKLEVTLMGGNQEVVQQFSSEHGSGLEDIQWHKVSHTFKNYGTGVRYILFYHAGRDTQYWAGHYGSKMAGGSVVAKLPAPFIENLIKQAE